MDWIILNRTRVFGQILYKYHFILSLIHFFLNNQPNINNKPEYRKNALLISLLNNSPSPILWNITLLRVNFIFFPFSYFSKALQIHCNLFKKVHKSNYTLNFLNFWGLKNNSPWKLKRFYGKWFFPTIQIQCFFKEYVQCNEIYSRILLNM